MIVESLMFSLRILAALQYLKEQVGQSTMLPNSILVMYGSKLGRGTDYPD
jgi:hypothetical protein